MIATLAPVKAAACLLVGKDADFLAVAQNAARRLPIADIKTFQTLEEAVKNSAPSGADLLVLANRDKSDAEAAVKATDSTGMRRWAIVVLETTPAMEGIEVVPSAEWNEPMLARVFEAAVAKQKLIQENARLRGDLRTIAHRISHDLRTPLGGITTTCEVVKELLAEYNPTDASLTAPIFSSTEEVSRLIERVSFVLKASISPVVKKQVAMAEPVWAALQRLESRMMKKNASVAQPDSWPEVSGVERFLDMVWWNLLANALQHAGETPRIELGWSKDADIFRFWIRDNGNGVPPAAQARLFQPFQTLHEISSTRGLGLSITQRLVELQGGCCGYEPAAGGGARFFFTLPNT